MQRRTFIGGTLASSTATAAIANSSTNAVPTASTNNVQHTHKLYNILEFSAKADGKHVDTRAIQQAIDTCHANGGGTVILPSGHTLITGTIYLKSYVTLHIENGACLRASPNIDDYTLDTHHNLYKNEPHLDRCLIFAKNAEHIAIEGLGTIDGNGYWKNFDNKSGRPMLMRFLHCKHLQMHQINLINPASWTSAWLYCEHIRVSGIRIHSRVNNNGDGLDFDGCKNVRVSDCEFDTSDDSICLQASMPEHPCQDIVINNCIFESKWAGMRIGLLSRGDFSSVCVSNCVFKNIQDSGLKIQMNEGGTMKNMVFNNLVMTKVPRPIFMTFTQQKAFKDAPEEMYPMQSMSHFTFSNIIVDNSMLDKDSGIFITGMPGHSISNILLKDIQMTLAGGGTDQDAKRKLPEYTLKVLDGWWPEFHLVGTLPAAAIYLRHCDNIVLNNIQLEILNADKRPALAFDDVPKKQVQQVYLNMESIDKGY